MDSLNRVGLLCVRSGLSEYTATETVAPVEETWKVPDLLVFEPAALSSEERALLTTTDLPHQLPGAYDPGGQFHFASQKALCAIEAEFSPYKAREMKGRNWERRTGETIARRVPKNAKPPTAPNIWIKEEDLARLEEWERRTLVPVIVTHLFDQEGFAVGLSEVGEFDREFRGTPGDQIRLQLSKGIFKFVQRYNRVDAEGAREQKVVLVVAPCAAVKVGDVTGVTVRAQIGLSASKKYVAHVLFEGRRLELDPAFLGLLRDARRL